MHGRASNAGHLSRCLAVGAEAEAGTCTEARYTCTRAASDRPGLLRCLRYASIHVLSVAYVGPFLPASLQTR